MIYQIEPFFEKSTLNNLKKYIFSGSWFTEHKQTTRFEKKFSKFLRTKQSVMFPNGTLTMSSILNCLGIKRGDEVLVSNYTMVATANVAKMFGGKTVLVDIDKENLCMDPIDVKKKITTKTKFCIYTSINGRAGQIDEVMKICKKNNIKFIEDAAHSIGSYYKGKHLGTFGIAGSFSFSMPKLITTGQGGAVVSSNNKLIKKLRKFKDFGRKKSGIDVHDSLGYNYKITDMQSVLAYGQLKNINNRIKKKRMIYDLYYESLKNNKSLIVYKRKKNETPWSFDVYSKKIKKIKSELKKKKINTRDVYPPLNKQKIYRDIKGLSVSNFFCTHGLWLPSSINLNRNQIIKICNLINKSIK